MVLPARRVAAPTAAAVAAAVSRGPKDATRQGFVALRGTLAAAPFLASKARSTARAVDMPAVAVVVLATAVPAALALRRTPEVFFLRIVAAVGQRIAFLAPTSARAGTD